MSSTPASPSALLRAARRCGRGRARRARRDAAGAAAPHAASCARRCGCPAAASAPARPPARSGYRVGCPPPSHDEPPSSGHPLPPQGTRAGCGAEPGAVLLDLPLPQAPAGDLSGAQVRWGRGPGHVWCRAGACLRVQGSRRSTLPTLPCPRRPHPAAGSPTPPCRFLTWSKTAPTTGALPPTWPTLPSTRCERCGGCSRLPAAVACLLRSPVAVACLLRSPSAGGGWQGSRLRAQRDWPARLLQPGAEPPCPPPAARPPAAATRRRR